MSETHSFLVTLEKATSEEGAENIAVVVTETKARKKVKQKLLNLIEEVEKNDWLQ
jgi:hypothetical protein